MKQQIVQVEIKLVLTEVSGWHEGAAALCDWLLLWRNWYIAVQLSYSLFVLQG